MIVPHDQLCIHEDVAAENQRSHDTVRKLNTRCPREEHSHKSEEYKHPQRTKEIRHPTRKIVLSLAREYRKRDKYAECKYKRLQHDPAIVEAGDDTDAVRLERSEASEENEVGGVGFAFPEGEQHEADCAEERDPEHPLV